MDLISSGRSGNSGQCYSDRFSDFASTNSNKINWVIYPQIKIIFLTMNNQVSIVRRAKELDTSGYLTKESSSTQIVNAIREAINGNVHFLLLERKDYLI